MLIPQHTRRRGAYMPSSAPLTKTTVAWSLHGTSQTLSGRIGRLFTDFGEL